METANKIMNNINNKQTRIIIVNIIQIDKTQKETIIYWSLFKPATKTIENKNPIQTNDTTLRNILTKPFKYENQTIKEKRILYGIDILIKDANPHIQFKHITTIENIQTLTIITAEITKQHTELYNIAENALKHTHKIIKETIINE